MHPKPNVYGLPVVALVLRRPWAVVALVSCCTSAAVALILRRPNSSKVNPQIRPPAFWSIRWNHHTRSPARPHADARSREVMQQTEVPHLKSREVKPQMQATVDSARARYPHPRSPTPARMSSLPLAYMLATRMTFWRNHWVWRGGADVPARGRSLCRTQLEHLGNPTNSPILVVKQKQAT
jgi:hypothetical protein